MEGSRNALSLMRASVEDGFSTLMMTSQKTNKEDNTMKKTIAILSMMIFLIGAAVSVKAANLAFETPDTMYLIYNPSDTIKLIYTQSD